MTDTFLDSATLPLSARPKADVLHGPLIGSRQRWQHLVSLAADLAFETDAKGRFVFVVPDQVLGWSAAALIGQPSELLLADSGDSPFNPFRPAVETRGRRIWIKRHDGTMVYMAFSAAPLLDALGNIVGSRGIAADVTEHQAQASAIAGSLRRGEVLDYILWCVAQEVMAPRMMDAALSALVNALAAEGAIVVAVREGEQVELLHESGPGSTAVREAAARLAAEHGAEAGQAITVDGRLVLAVGCQTRFGANAGLGVWRTADSRPWDRDDTMLVRSAASIIRMILEHESIQHEMGRQARTDPLTGLLNRRAFMEDMQRHAERLDQEHAPGTLMFVDMDAFKTVNDRLGHEMGDQTLVHVAKMLRDLVRPFDLIARLGGDEFAVWMGGADHLTAAERADHLRKTGPAELESLLGQPIPGLGLSIGIASRRAGSQEPIDDLIRRADMAMYEVKRSGRGHWRVSLLEGD
ncbi:diguanylate cyclase [Rhodopila sp.]|uniref:sensor domain-containing diguanylate cyclase n=1 Tax=Rhodopila sp. TaxID=2480087 RepID=UPI003D09AC54